MTAMSRRDEKEVEIVGPNAIPESDEDTIRDLIRANAWGHHASCTCPIG